MAITTVWDSAFETSPSDLMDKSLIPEEIHLIKVAIEQRMGFEHYFGPWSTPIVDTDEDSEPAPDNGKHWPGHVTVASYDTLANRLSTGVQKGALYVMKWQEDGTTTGRVLQMYDGASWVTATSSVHAALAGTSNDDHPLYVLLGSADKNRNSFDAGVNLNLGGNYLYTGNINDAAANTVWITEDHVVSGTHSFDVAAFDTIPINPLNDPTVSGGTENCKLWLHRNSNGKIIPLVDTGHVTGLATGTQASVALSTNGFFPSIRVYCSDTGGTLVYSPSNYNTGASTGNILMQGCMKVGITLNGSNLVIQNNTGYSIDYRVVQFGFETGALA
jgi:hypothetical protein